MISKALALLLALTVSVHAQTVSYFNQGFLRQPSAQADRDYLGIYGSNIFNWGTNCPCGGGGGGTNSSFATNSMYATIATNGPNGQPLLTANQPISLTGDVTGGPASTSIATTLKNTGTAGTYTKTTFDAQGRETSGGSAALASADFANQGSATTLLHGNAAGNPSWSAVDLANDVAGNLGVTHLNSGTGAGGTTFWRGDGTWGIPAGVGQTPWLASENAANYSLSNLANLSVNSIYITNSGGGNPYGSISGVGNKGTFDFHTGNSLSGLSLAFPSTSNPQLSLYVGGQNSLVSEIIGTTPVGAIHYGNGGLYLFTSDLIGLGTSGSSAAANALMIDQPNSRITTKTGVALIINDTAYGNGAGLTNAQFTSQIRSNYVMIQGLATNLNFIPGTNTTVTATNFGGRLDIAFNAAGGGTDANAWHQTGDAVPSTNVFIGTVNNQPMTIKVNNTRLALFDTNFSIAQGANASATVGGAVAIGTSSKALNAGTVALGDSTASGVSSVAIAGATASGEGALAIGPGNLASGQYSVAIGYQSGAFGKDSFSAGLDVQAQFDGSFVFADSQGSEIWDTGPDQFVATFNGGIYLNDNAGSTVSVLNGVLTATAYNNYRAGSASVTALATSKTITFSTALASASYAPTVTVGFSLGTISMYVDTLTASGFVVHFTSPVAGGTLYYNAVLNQ